MSNLNTNGVQDWFTAERFLNGRKRAVPCYATELIRMDDYIEVRHHGTAIIRYTPDSISIRNCGWLTVTTTGRLNAMTPASVIVSRARGGSVRAPKWTSDYIPDAWTEVA